MNVLLALFLLASSSLQKMKKTVQSVSEFMSKLFENLATFAFYNTSY